MPPLQEASFLKQACFPISPQAECSRSSTAVLALLRSWRAGSPAHAARALGSSADGLLDLAPALRDISRPAAVRAVNAQLLSREEDRVLGHVVSEQQCDQWRRPR